MVIEISEGAFNVKSLKQILDYLKVCNGQHTVSTEKNTAIMKLLDGVPHYLELYKELVVKSENGISFSNSIEVVVDSPSLGQIAVNDLYNFLKKSFPIFQFDLCQVHSAIPIIHIHLMRKFWLSNI